MEHSAHRRHRPRRALPSTRPHGLNKSGFGPREGYSRRNRRSSISHSSLGTHVPGRLTFTELRTSGQALLLHSSESFRSQKEKFSESPEPAETENKAASLQTVQLQSPPEQKHRELGELILQRIQTRIPGRVRNLTVRITDDSVELTGTCRTYYTKQMAQHAAMGVLDYQQLVNNINVEC